jgi:hypothetical protein
MILAYEGYVDSDVFEEAVVPRPDGVEESVEDHPSIDARETEFMLSIEDLRGLHVDKRAHAEKSELGSEQFVPLESRLARLNRAV